MAGESQYATKLAGVKLFSSFKKHHLHDLAAAITYRTVPAKEILYRAGENSKKIIIAAYGALEKVIRVNGFTVIVETLSAMDAWGYENIPSPSKKYDYTLRNGAAEAAVMELNIYAVLQLLKERPTLKDALYQNIVQLQAERLMQQEKRIGLLYALNALFSAGSHSSDTLETALDLLVCSVRASQGLLVQFDAPGNRIMIEQSLNYTPELTGNTLPFTSDTVLSLTYATGQPLIITPETFERHFANVTYSKPSMLIVPMRQSGAVAGALLLTRESKSSCFTTDDAALLTAAASLLAMHLLERDARQESKHAEQLRRTYIASLTRW